jgi:putative aldouronate transport system substrate-binding protein
MLRSDEFELPRTTDWSGKKDMFARFDSFSIKDPYSSFQFVSDNVESEIAAINQICMQYGASIIFGKVDDVESAVEDLRAKLTNAGIDKVIEEVKSQVEDYKK